MPSQLQRSLIVIFLVLLAGGNFCRGEEKEFFFHDGDTPVLFLGDSITEQQRYTVYIEAYVLSRYPKWNIQFRNIGIGGDTAALERRGGIEAGLQRDVFPLKPKAITVDFGMNDARSGNDQNFNTHTQKLIDLLIGCGARVALCTPSPEEKFQPDQPGGSGYNKLLAQCSEDARKIAADRHIAFADQYTPFVNVINEVHLATKDASHHLILIPDTVHPNWAGHLVMATSILKDLGAPALVSRLEWDATGKSNPKCDHCTANAVMRTASYPGEIAFQRTDDCIPWPLPAGLDFLLFVPHFDPLGDLNRYELKVTNLAATRYELFIDGESVGKFSRDDLQAGVNLAMRAGPITRQGEQLWNAIGDKNGLWIARWRNGQLAGKPQAELDKIDAKLAEQEKKMTALRQPKTHEFSLVPTKE